MFKKLSKENLINLVLLASSLQILESFFPHPIPGVRFGLANLVSLLVVVKFGLIDGLKVASLRTFVSSLFLGNFLSVSFILSFFSALVAVVFMWIIHKISLHTFLRFSIFGVSIFGAVAHNITQLALVYFLFINQIAIFLFLPILIVSAVIFGGVVGILALDLVNKVGNLEAKKTFQNEPLVRQFVTCDKINFKLWIILSLIIFIFIFSKIYIQIGILVLILVTLFSNKVSFKVYLKNIKKIFWLLIFSFFLPLFSIKGHNVLVSFKSFMISKDALYKSLMYSFRLINIVSISTFITNVYSKETLVNMAKNLLFFNRDFVEVLLISFYNLDFFLDEIKQKFNLKAKNMKKFYENILEIFLEYIN